MFCGSELFSVHNVNVLRQRESSELCILHCLSCLRYDCAMFTVPAGRSSVFLKAHHDHYCGMRSQPPDYSGIFVWVYVQGRHFYILNVRENFPMWTVKMSLDTLLFRNSDPT